MKRFLLIFFVLFLCLGGCAPHALSEHADTSASADTEKGEEWLLQLDGRRYSFDGSSDCLVAEEDCLSIVSGGTYRITGTLTEGALRIDAPPDQVVRLILDGVSVTSSYHAPLCIREAACVVLELEEGSVNRLTDTERQGNGSTIPDGCLVADCDLVIKGKGSLYLSGRQDTALVCEGDLHLSEASLSVSAPSVGVWVRDRLRMEGGSLTVSSAKRGIVTDSGDASAGLLDFSGGRLTVSCTETALVASRQIRLRQTETSLRAPSKYQAPSIDAP